MSAEQDKVVVASILADAVEEIRRARAEWIMEQVRLISIVQTRSRGSWTSEDADRWTQKYVQDWNADNPGLYGLWTYYEQYIRPRPPEGN